MLASGSGEQADIERAAAVLPVPREIQRATSSRGMVGLRSTRGPYFAGVAKNRPGGLSREPSRRPRPHSSSSPRSTPAFAGVDLGGISPGGTSGWILATPVLRYCLDQTGHVFFSFRERNWDDRLAFQQVGPAGYSRVRGAKGPAHGGWWRRNGSFGRHQRSVGRLSTVGWSATDRRLACYLPSVGRVPTVGLPRTYGSCPAPTVGLAVSRLGLAPGPGI